MSIAGALVLVIEDDAALRRLLCGAMTSNGYRVVDADDAQQARAMAVTHNPDVVLLDLGLPDADGIELTRELRGRIKAPIVVVSARGREEDKIAALDAGADDYLTKPFGIGELLARLRVALRHARGRALPADPLLEVGPLRIERERREVTMGGREVHLTPTEYRLLAFLVENAGKVLTHAVILEHVWGPTASSHPHYVRVQVAELRKKIEDDPARPRWLVTEPGVGYRFRDRDPG